MYIQTTKYMEEAWGAKVPVYESELIVDKYEVEDLIMDQLFDDETYPGDWKFYFTDDYNDEEIEIDADRNRHGLDAQPRELALGLHHFHMQRHVLVLVDGGQGCFGSKCGLRPQHRELAQDQFDILVVVDCLHQARK